MAPKKPSTFQKAHLRGLLDQPRADGAVDKSGQPILERKPLHERRRILARVRREEPSKKREEEFDVPAKEMMEASEIVQADQDWVEQRRRGRKMERMGRDQGVGRTPSPERREGGERQQLAKRKREEDEEDEETAGSPEPMENLAPGPSSASPLAPPAKRQRTGARSTDLDLRVHVVDAGLSAAAAASLALPREVLLRVPCMSTGAELVPLLETALLGAGQGGQSSGAAAMGGSGWSWEFVVQHGEGGTETTRLEEGIWLVVFLDVGEEGPLVVEGRVKGV